MTRIEEMGAVANQAARKLATLGEEKTTALLLAAKRLREKTSEIISANEKDIEAAKAGGMATVMLDRLMLSAERIDAMAVAIEDVAKEADPVGKILDGEKRPNGLAIERITVPLGVVGIIYESRPNVTSDAAALCIKAGNAVILRGGKEAYASNRAITDVLAEALTEGGLPEGSVQLIEDTSRKSATELMDLVDYLDVLIPRGGAGLINAVKNGAKVPVIETGVGNCHVYVDEFADIDMAKEIIFNAKTSRPSVCNSIETIIVHEKIAERALPEIKSRLDEKNVEIRADERAAGILPDTTPATEDDWYAEFLDYILAVKIVSSLDEAMEHIAKYSTGHSEAIITDSLANADRFIEGVNSAAVYVNSSTRFTDGGEFGLGAELGISTQKLHARGPMGLSHLTSYKYVVRGKGHVR